MCWKQLKTLVLLSFFLNQFSGSMMISCAPCGKILIESQLIARSMSKANHLSSTCTMCMCVSSIITWKQETTRKKLWLFLLINTIGRNLTEQAEPFLELLTHINPLFLASQNTAYALSQNAVYKIRLMRVPLVLDPLISYIP